MGQFSYVARDARGKTIKGRMDANAKADVKAQLLRMRLTPVTITTEKLSEADGEKTSFWANMVYKDDRGRLQIDPLPARLSSKDLIVFTKQFATMLASGVSLIQSLDILSRQQRVRSFGATIKKIRYAVENGATLSESLEAFPASFDTLYVAMVRASEASGNLDTILKKLVTYIEKAAKIKSQVKSAMMYPAIIVVVATSVIAGLLLFVVPTFARQFQESGKELPGLTQLVIDMSNVMMTYWYAIPGVFIGLPILIRAWTSSDDGRRQFDTLLLKIPAIGDLLRKIAISRFCSTLATMLASGVSILDALNICAASAGNKQIEEFIMTVRAGISEGQAFSVPLAKGGLFPPMVVSMVEVGEKSGALDDMLAKVSEFYEEEVDMAIKGVLSLIEPVLIVVIGGIVGFVVIAMYLPVFDMASVIGG